MAKKDWKHEYFYIVPRGSTNKDEWLSKIPVLGIKQTDNVLAIKRAFENAVALLKDSQYVSEYSKIILLSLSAELFLKAIIYKTTNSIAWGHDLHELYYTLNENERNSLLDCYLLRTIPKECFNENFDTKLDEAINDFESCLCMSAVCFETLRYNHELSTYAYDLGFIHNFAVDLNILSEKLGFKCKT